MADLAPLFVAIPLAAAFLSLLARGLGPRVAFLLTLGSTLALLLLAGAAVRDGGDGVSYLGDWGPAKLAGLRFVSGIALVLDGLSRLFLLVVAVVSVAVVVYCPAYLRRATGRPLFYTLLNLLVAGMNGVVLAGDLFNFFVFMEIASIASYALVAYGTGGHQVEAAFKYLMLGCVAGASLLLGIAVLYSATGMLNMADVAAAISEGRVPDRALLFAGALFLTGLGLKSAMMPFHAWLPDAHPSAPAPISAMLSGLLIKTLGIYAIVRIFFVVFGVDPRTQTLLLALGSLSMVAGVLLALGQDDLKRLLAYHSISQMGFVLVALGTDTRLGIAAGLFHAMNHALFKSALFLSAGSLERLAGTRRLSEMGGLLRRAPGTGLGTIGAALSISGVPPFNGFWSKLLILLALVDAGFVAVAGIAAVVAVMTLISFVKVQRKALFGALPERLAEVREVPSLMLAPILGLVALCLLTGLLWPFGVGDLVQSAAGAVKSAGEAGSAVGRYVQMVLGR